MIESVAEIVKALYIRPEIEVRALGLFAQHEIPHYQIPTGAWSAAALLWAWELEGKSIPRPQLKTMAVLVAADEWTIHQCRHRLRALSIGLLREHPELTQVIARSIKRLGEPELIILKVQQVESADLSSRAIVSEHTLYVRPLKLIVWFRCSVASAETDWTVTENKKRGLGLSPSIEGLLGALGLEDELIPVLRPEVPPL